MRGRAKPYAQRLYLYMRRYPTTIAFVVLGAAIVFTFGRGESTRNIITRSACAEDPNSAECQTVKRQSDQQQSVQDACISFKKVGYPCPAPKSERRSSRDHREGDAANLGSGISGGGLSGTPPTPPSVGTPPPDHRSPGLVCDLTTQLGVPVCVGL